MSDVEQMIGLIDSILQNNDKAGRQNAQNILTQLRSDKPNQLINVFLVILESNTKTLYRNFSTSQLRLNLSNFSPTTYKNLWSSITTYTQNLVKVKLFQVIYKENDLSMKRHVADTLGQIAGTIITNNQNGWPQFKNNIWTLFQDQNIGANLAAFYILQTFFNYCPQHFQNDTNELYALFKNSLVHQNVKLRLSSLKCFSSYLQVLETKKYASFQQLILPIYESVLYILINDNSNDDGLQTLAQMIETQPKFFKKKFKELHELLKNIFKLIKISSGIKRMTTQILLDFSQKYPALYRKKPDILQSVIQMIFVHMVDIDPQIQQQWKKPAEGFNDQMADDDDFQTTRFGMGAVDRLIYAVGQEQVMPVLSNTIQKLLVQQDWRYKYTAVMALSQVGQYIEDIDKISSVLQMIASFLKDENPMMRYAACHAIGQISDDMQPKFQQKYGNQLLPVLIELLNDPIPRVISHSAACLTNFLQGMKYPQIQPSMDLLMNLLINLAYNGISVVQQSALSAISSIVQIAKSKFFPYLNKSMEILFNFFNENKYHGTQYKQLKGQAIETMTIIASSVGKQIFKPAAPQLIDLMIKLQNSQFQQIDPQKCYILAGWQRLCIVYGKQLGQLLDKILPSLFALVENVIKNELQSLKFSVLTVEDTAKNNKSQKQPNINTFQTQQAQVAISMLNIFIEELKQLYSPYVQKTVELLCVIINEHPNEDVKQQACKCLPSLISAVKTTDSKVAIDMAKYFMNILVMDVQKSTVDTQTMLVQLQTLKCIIQQLDLCFLTQTQVSTFSQKILQLLKNSDTKKLNNNSLKKEQQIDEQQKQLIDQQIKQQQQVQVAISELFGILFKTHKNMTINLAKYIINNILPSVFIENQSDNMYKFGIFLIDDMIDYLGFQILQNQWFNFGALLMKFIHQKNCVLRQAACYGLGIFTQKTPSNAINTTTLQPWLNGLVESIKLPKGSEKQKTYGHCRDNAIAALGKIIKTHAQLFNITPYLTFWLAYLPLKFDKPQAIIQHQFLVDIMINRAQLILGDTQDMKLISLQKILAIYGDILSNSKLINENIKKKIKINLEAINSNDFFHNYFKGIWNNLTEKQKHYLTQLINNN